MDSKGTWTLAKEMSGAFMGLPCCWNDAGWNRGLPEPAVQLLGKGTGGAPGAATGSPAAAINGAEVTVVGKEAPENTEGVTTPWVAVLEEKDRKNMGNRAESEAGVSPQTQRQQRITRTKQRPGARWEPDSVWSHVR